MRYLAFLLCVLIFACQPEEEEFTTDSSVQLRFSTDTLVFDTVFTSLGSVTQRMRIYNDADNAVNISDITLSGGSDSPFDIFINGLAGPSLSDVRILGKDSILVLAQVTIDPMDQNLPFIVEDRINFTTNGNNQQVELVAWGQDANFLRDSVLSCNTTWTKERPYVIYNSVLVEAGCNLTVEPGTSVYNHNGSFIFIAGSLTAEGTATEKILFTNDRFDAQFKDAPGQWGGIIFLQGSNGNSIDHASIRNANVGLYLGTPDDNDEADLRLTNTRIENIGGNAVIPSIDSLVQPGFGLISISSDLYASNVLINNCEINAFAAVAGGNYVLEHCTIGSFSFDFFRRDPSLVISNNLVLGDNSLLVGDLNFDMKNSIVWGSLQEELLLSAAEEAAYNLVFERNIIRTLDDAILIDNFSENPKFFNPGNYNYELDTLSPAKDVGLDLGIITDLNGTERDDLPDLGAFERIENN